MATFTCLRQEHLPRSYLLRGFWIGATRLDLHREVSYPRVPTRPCLSFLRLGRFSRVARSQPAIEPVMGARRMGGIGFLGIPSLSRRSFARVNGAVADPSLRFVRAACGDWMREQLVASTTADYDAIAQQGRLCPSGRYMSSPRGKLMSFRVVDLQPGFGPKCPSKFRRYRPQGGGLWPALRLAPNYAL